MDKPKFTPGDWKASGWADDKKPFAIMHPKKPGVAIAMLSNIFLPAVGFNDGDSEELTANTYIMAASKDLYEALERMIRLLKENYQLDDLAGQVINKSEAALKKARGE